MGTMVQWWTQPGVELEDAKWRARPGLGFNHSKSITLFLGNTAKRQSTSEIAVIQTYSSDGGSLGVLSLGICRICRLVLTFT